MSLDQIMRDVYKDCISINIHRDKQELIELSVKPKEEIRDWIVKNASIEIKKENIFQFDIVTEKVEISFINVIYRL